jgi:hypothetical protein
VVEIGRLLSKVDTIEELHVLKEYFHSLGFVIITETMVLSTKHPEETFIDELRTDWVSIFVKSVIERGLFRNQ